MRDSRIRLRMTTARFLFAIGVATVLSTGLSPTASVSAQAGSSPTFNTDIAPILYNKCATCHRAGAVGAMSLTSYKEVRPWARSIKARVTKREMPPWSADPRFGEYLNDNSLTQAQIDLVARWVDAGSPEGSGAATPLPKFPEGGWRLINGRGPDVVLEMPMEYELPAEGQIPVFRMWQKNPFKEDVYIQALQIQPSDPSVTHHSALTARPLPEGTTLKKGIGWKNGPELTYIPTYPDGSIVNVLTAGGASLSIEGAEGTADIKPGDRVPKISKIRQPGEEDDDRLMFYLPGADFQVFPEGSAKRMRASNDFLWELHYSPNGKPTRDRERVALWFAKTPPKHEVRVIRNGSGQHIIENGEVGNTANLPVIPPNAADWKITAIQPFTEDTTVATMQPHMHLRGNDMTYVATYPDGHEEVLLSVPKYDFNWQNTYMPVKPVHLPAGSVLKTVGHYNNSVTNKVNPQPNRPALWSEQTWDEMYNAWTELTFDGETHPPANATEAKARAAKASERTPIASFVGCAVPGTATRWTLQNASRLSAPAAADGAVARVTHNLSKDEAEAAAKLAVGQDTLALVGVSDFVSAEESLANPVRKALYPINRVNSTGALAAGRRVAVKGVYVPGSPATVNLTSVVQLEGNCTPQAQTGQAAQH